MLKTAILGLCMALIPSLVLAAQQIVTANQGSLLDDIETVLGEQQIEIVEQADTDRFAIIYASRANGAHITITLAQAPHEATQITLRVASDSPPDEILDQQLLERLLQTLNRVSN